MYSASSRGMQVVISVFIVLGFLIGYLINVTVRLPSVAVVTIFFIWPSRRYIIPLPRVTVWLSPWFTMSIVRLFIVASIVAGVFDWVYNFF